MFLRPSEEELENFEEEWLVLCAPGYECPDPENHGLRQGNFSILNFTKKIALVGGSAYTGEMKKGIFTALNASWREATPLGRAEWLKYTALFYNVESQAETIYTDIVTQYTAAHHRDDEGCGGRTALQNRRQQDTNEESYEGIRGRDLELGGGLRTENVEGLGKER